MTAGSDARPHLEVAADLRLEIDGLPVHITGDGRDLEVYTADGAGLVGALLRTRDAGVGSPLHSLGVVARQLDESGLSVTVTSGLGSLVSVGHGQRSKLSGLVPAARHIRPGSARVLLPTAWGVVHRSPAWPRVKLGAFTLISVFAISAAARRIHH